MQGNSAGVWWIFIVAGLVTVILTATMVGLILLAQRRQVEQSRRFSQGTVESLEAEQARIARELHDDVMQRIALVGGELSVLGRLVPNPSDAATQKMDGIREELDDLADEVRKMARRAHPAVLDHLGLVKALQSLASEVAVAHGLEVRVLVDPDHHSDRLSPAAALSLYRVAQEGLRNVSRHAGTGEAAVQLSDQDGGVLLTIEDRGRGMHPMLERGKGLGLLGLEERIRAVQGRLTLESAPGRGTRLHAWVPYQGDEP